MSTKKQLSTRIASFLLTMLMVITAAPVTVISAESSGTADAQLIVDSVFAMPGETVEMNITLKNAPTVKSMSISNITFDTDKMTLTNVWSEQYVASTTTHYTFYHRYGWGYNTSTGKNSYVWGSDSQLGSGERHEIDLIYDLSKSSNFAGNSCWKGYTCPHCGQANVWLGRSTYVAENKADRWYYQEPVYTYYYYRDVSQEAMNKPDEQENISNVQKWVKYIVK